jgi:hypothetical protein
MDQTTFNAKNLSDVKEAEKVLKAKQDKYGKAPTDFNENTAFVVRYLTEFLAKLGIHPENLGA